MIKSAIFNRKSRFLMANQDSSIRNQDSLIGSQDSLIGSQDSLIGNQLILPLKSIAPAEHLSDYRVQTLRILQKKHSFSGIKPRIFHHFQVSNHSFVFIIFQERFIIFRRNHSAIYLILGTHTIALCWGLL